ncbi:MAG: uroporphyrinogen-III C-methyltransferase [Phycisphaerae bacterium]
MNAVHGTVYLVGAGPGDPGLLTVRGRDLLRQADVVVHDRLLGLEMLAEVPRGAEIIHVGKEPGCHTAPQGEINALLIDRARRGSRVVRLKGGDPFVFGRGFEEVSACRAAGIECVVVPGVTSAVAAPAAAGIPITDRLHVRSVAIITARTARDCPDPPLNYKALAAMDTVVVLMGRAKLQEVTRSLIAAGRDPATPAACIEWATTPRQRVTLAPLSTLAQSADRDGLRAPVVTVIGDVAAHANDPPTRSARKQ